MELKNLKLGRLYVFEGVDGVGKSSLAKLFFETMHKTSQDCCLLSFPGRTPSTLGNLVYKLHHDPNQVDVEKISPSGLQAAHVAAHIDAIESVIIPKLKAGTTIILDRFWWSMNVYGNIEGVNKKIIEKLIELELVAWQMIVPTVAFLIQRNFPLRNEPLEKWHLLCAEYKLLSHKESKLYPVFTIDNNGNLEDALTKILHSVRAINELENK